MRIAIFGGTFDPIHNAHLTVAREAVEKFHLDKVLFVTAGNPPHKEEPVTPYELRHRMVELACEGEPRFEPSRLDAVGRSYSIHTIEKVKARLRPEDQLFFLIGADAFAEIQSWYRAEDVIGSVEFIVAARPGHTYSVPPGARVHRLDTVAFPVSSSGIRRKLAAREPVPELPPKVYEFILEHGLYQDQPSPKSH
ncbi:MAG: nicotinate (nicotinamide) nucleotide adenylyltransferase [Bryobacteraceae bacterium]|nr:nicotinate (nicotinamide) nucleotide adenylyltransferase [Bryobacteraceae bacterium]